MDNTTISVKNTYDDGFASVYFSTQRSSTVFETSQIFSGQGAGVNLKTHGPQPMCFHTDNVPAIEISGTGEGNIYIYNPVVLSSSLTCGDIKSTGTPGVNILKSDGSTAVKVYDSGTTQFTSNVIMDGNLSVTGSINLISFLPLKPWFGFLVTTDAAGVATAGAR